MNANTQGDIAKKSKSFGDQLRSIAGDSKMLKVQKVTDFDDILSTVEKNLFIFSSSELSKVIWSLGKLKCPITKLNKIDGFLDVVMSHVTDLMTFQESGNTTHFSLQMVDSFQMIFGLGYLGFNFSHFSPEARKTYIDVLVSSDKNKFKDTVDNREFSSVFYSLGQLKVSKMKDLDKSQRKQVISNMFTRIFVMIPTGFCNSLYGIGRAGFRAHEDINTNQIHYLLDYVKAKIKFFSVNEILSLMGTFAVLDIKWDSIKDYDSELATDMVNLLCKNLKIYSNKELANMIFSLGEIGVKFVDLDDEIRTSFESKFSTSLNTFTIFDFETIIGGLGDMKLNFAQDLDNDTQLGIIIFIQKEFKRSNIFAAYKIILGLSRMNCNVLLLGEDATKIIFDHLIFLYHTFLRPQMSEIIWSLGSLQFSVKTHLTEEQASRLLAITTRIFSSLDNSDSPYVLLGLLRLGYTWKDFLNKTKSVSTGVEIDPFAMNIAKFIKDRLGNIKSNELAIFLYTLSKLELSRSDLSKFRSIDKLYDRMNRLSYCISSTSTALIVMGFANMDNFSWAELPEIVRKALQDAFLNENRNSNNDYNKGLQSNFLDGDYNWLYESRNNQKQFNKVEDGQGIKGMNSFELQQTIHGLASLKCKADDLSKESKSIIIESYKDKRNRSPCVWSNEEITILDLELSTLCV